MLFSVNPTNTIVQLRSFNLRLPARPGCAQPVLPTSPGQGKIAANVDQMRKDQHFRAHGGLPPTGCHGKTKMAGKFMTIQLSPTAFSNAASMEGKPMSCASSVFISVKRMGVCNFFHLCDKENHCSSCNGGIFRAFSGGGFDEINRR